jgi:hypothetical protein
MACADEPISYATIGTQTVGVAVGTFFPIRVTPSQSSKLFGTAAMPSWSMTITGPISSNWYRGQVALGAEFLVLGTSEPVTGSGVGITPKLQYTFVGLDWLRPYIEGGGGPIWTDLGGRVPEQPGGVQLYRLGRGRVCMASHAPMGPERRLSVRPHFQWWDTHTKFRSQLRPPVCRNFLFPLLISRRMLETSASFVLASLRGLTYSTEFVPPLRSLRPRLRNGASWRAGVGRVRSLAVLSILRAVLAPAPFLRSEWDLSAD